MTIDQASVTGTALRPLDLPTELIMLTAGLLPALALIGVTAVLPQIEAALAHDTYMIDGRQYVVIATSNSRNPKGPRGSAYVAFALPEQ
jgi:hypothetical protein